MRRGTLPPWGHLLVAGAVLASGCSVRKMAINKIGDALSSGGSVYESDEDLELVGDALPFSLKLIESLLAETPRHEGLLRAAAKGFTSYSKVYVHDEAAFLADQDFAQSRELLIRARKLYLRGHRYALRALELSHPGFADALVRAPETTVLRVENRELVPLLYWSAASLGLAISAGRNEASLLARLPEVDALLGRALELDEAWNDGALYEVDIALSAARPGKLDLAAVRGSFDRARVLSRGCRAGLYVSYAETVAIAQQDRDQFRTLLEKALGIDPDAHPSIRLANLVAQRRARWLLARTDELILATPPAPTKGDRK